MRSPATANWLRSELASWPRNSRQLLQNETLRLGVAGTGINDLAQGVKFPDLVLNLFEVAYSQALDLGAPAALILVQLEQRPAGIDGKSEAAGPPDEAQPREVLLAVLAVAVVLSRWSDQADFFVVPDGLDRQTAEGGRITDVHGILLTSRLEE